MSRFVMSYRSQAGARCSQELLAGSLADAWARAFALAQALGGSAACGFCVRRVGAAV